MMILAGGLRAVLRERGPQTTSALASAIGAPEERVRALMWRLHANREVECSNAGWRLALERDDGYARELGLSPDAFQNYMRARDSDAWPSECGDCPYNDGSAACQCV